MLTCLRWCWCKVKSVTVIHHFGFEVTPGTWRINSSTITYFWHITRWAGCNSGAFTVSHPHTSAAIKVKPESVATDVYSWQMSGTDSVRVWTLCVWAVIEWFRLPTDDAGGLLQERELCLILSTNSLQRHLRCSGCNKRNKRVYKDIKPHTLTLFYNIFIKRKINYCKIMIEFF